MNNPEKIAKSRYWGKITVTAALIGGMHSFRTWPTEVSIPKHSLIHAGVLTQIINATHCGSYASI